MFSVDGVQHSYPFDIDKGGFATNPETGLRERIFAVYGELPPSNMDRGTFTHDWMDFRFSSDPRGLTEKHVSMEGFWPRFRPADPLSDFDKIMQGVVVGGLAAIGGVATAGAFGVGPAATGGAASGAATAETVGAFGGMDAAAVAGADYGASLSAAEIAAFEGGAHLGSGATSVSPLTQFSSLPEWVSGAGKAVATGVGSSLMNRARSYIDNLLAPTPEAVQTSAPDVGGGAFDPGGNLFIAPPTQSAPQGTSTLAWTAIVGAAVLLFALLLKGK